MTTSDQINELTAALALAQSEIVGATKDSANPFFKSKYADLASVWDACRGPLTTNGIAIIQSPSADGCKVTLETLMSHVSGQWIRNVLSVNAKEDSPQAIGSAITYLRRYVLQSLAGVAPEEDDAEAAHGRGNGNGKAAQPTSRPVAVPSTPTGFEEWLVDMTAVAQEGTDRLRVAWMESKPEYRHHLTTTANAKWEALKATAAKLTPVTA